jgi:hypothetical protein
VKRVSTTFLMSLLLIAITTISTTNISFAAKRNILIEEATGDWCGPCGLYGKPAMKDILEQYEGSVMGVELHISDDYQFSYGYLIYDQYGDGGVPVGFINRMPIFGDNSDETGIHPIDWPTAIQNLQPGEAECEAEIKVTHTVDEANSIVVIDIEATFENVDAITGDIVPVFNYYIVENGIVGKQVVSGEGTIEPYVHDHVARAIGDPNGIKNSFPETVEANVKYTQHYEVAIQAGWDPQNLEVIGTVMYYDNVNKTSVVVNCAKGNVIRPFEITRNPDLPTVFVGSQADKFEYSFEIKNIMEETDDYELTISASERTPDDWTVSSDDPQMFSLEPGASKTITFEMVAGAEMGIGEALARIRSENSGGYTTSIQITALHRDIENIEIMSNGESFSLVPFQYELDDVYTISTNVANEVGTQLTNIKTVLFNSGANGRVTDKEAGVLKSFIESKAKILISGGSAAYDLDANCTEHKLLPMLGCQYVSQSDASGTYKIKGYDNDPISDGLSINANRQTYAVNHVSANSASARDILHIDGETLPIGIRSGESDTKSVVLGFNLNDIDKDQNKSRLLNSIIAWLLAEGETGAVISVAGDVEFERTKITKSSYQTLTINNDGTETLSINDLKVDESFQNIFHFPEVYIDGLFEPFDVEPGSSVNITCEFIPSTAKLYETYIIIESNSKNLLPDVVIRGEGFDPNSVGEISELPLLLEVLPNPITNSGRLHYRINGNGVNDLNIDLIDISGRVVVNLVNSTNSQQEGYVEIPMNKLTSGTYFAVAKIRGKFAEVQVVVAK